MDPRTSARVTAPDLLRAFTQGRGADTGTEDSGPELRIWMVCGTKDGGPEYMDFPMTSDGLAKALQLAKEYLSREGGVALIVTAKDNPMEAISAADD